VAGEPHALMGQVVTARVGLNPDAPEAKDATKRIRQHCRQRLAPHKVPMKIELTAEPLVTSRQKALRRPQSGSP
jgi:long-chain acyl-CoA synthetase